MPEPNARDWTLEALDWLPNALDFSPIATDNAPTAVEPSDAVILLAPIAIEPTPLESVGKNELNFPGSVILYTFPSLANPYVPQF